MPADLPSITKFAQLLVQTPSQGGIDSPDAVVEETYKFARQLGLPAVKILDDSGKPVAVVAEIKGAHPGKTWAVNATLDTAPVGDLAQWKDNPFSGKVQDQILHGRGAGDSKLAASMFTHLAKDFMAEQANMHGSFLLILDADEHTGNFGGIKSALAAGYKPDGIMIGYAGDDKFVVGSRGFSRYEIKLEGQGGHSGASVPVADSALLRAAGMVQDLSSAELSAPEEGEFNRQPKLTVTGISGGDSFSVVPRSATISVDMRLTPSFNEAAADRHIRRIVAENDRKNGVPIQRTTQVVKAGSEPPFLTPENAELRVALREAIAEITGKRVPELVAGPSNIGNFMAAQGIEVTAGYGVAAKGVHAADEQANLRKLPKVYDVYKKAMGRLLKL